MDANTILQELIAQITEYAKNPTASNGDILLRYIERVGLPELEKIQLNEAVDPTLALEAEKYKKIVDIINE